MLPLIQTLQTKQDTSRLSPSHPNNPQSANKSRRSVSDHTSYPSVSKRQTVISVQLSPIPGSPNATDASAAPSLASKPSLISNGSSNGNLTVPKEHDSPGRQSTGSGKGSSHNSDSISRARSKSSNYTAHRPQQPQSLNAALQILTTSPSEGGHGGLSPRSPSEGSIVGSTNEYGSSGDEISTTTSRRLRDIHPSPSRPLPDAPKNQPTVGGKGISAPVLNHGNVCFHSIVCVTYASCAAATMSMSPVKNRANGQPITVSTNAHSTAGTSVTTLASGYARFIHIPRSR